MGDVPDVDVVVRGSVEVRWLEAAGSSPDRARERAVAEVWARALEARGGGLHDSPILVFRRIEKRQGASIVYGEYVPYRFYFARRELEDVGLEADPIGVNGMTVVSEGSSRSIVLGRRSSTVAWYPGLWEWVPSGGLDRRCARAGGVVDFAAMLLEEFEEELCLPADRARVEGAFGLVYDRATHTYDVCCKVVARSSPRELHEAVRHSGEYSELRLVPESDVAEAAKGFGEALIPTARAMAGLYGDLP
jgi:hypothetical protein